MEPPTPIAIVGMACRFSGDVDSPEKLWKMCAEGRSGWSRIPPSRFNLEGVYHEHGDRTGTVIRKYQHQSSLGVWVCVADMLV